jgi:hypothetical protein
MRWRRPTCTLDSPQAEPASVSPAGPAIGVLVVISLIVAAFLTGKRTVRGSYSGMAKLRRIRLLEVNLIALKPDQWEWRVCEGEMPIVIGFENSREAAQIEGDRALFRLLSAGLDK